MPVNKFALIGGVGLCLTAVALGAFGAHALSEILMANGRLPVYELANRYQFYHGLAMMMIGTLSSQGSLPNKIPAVLMLVGTVIFSGSLYLLAISNLGWLGAITPIGGVLLLTAWSWLLWQVYRRN